MESPAALPRLLLGWAAEGAIGLDRHRELHGDLPLRRGRGEELIHLAERSGLRGRGGSGFPAAVKMQAVTSSPGRRRRVVLANGAESEPGSVKDSSIVASAPHLLLDGVAAAAEAVDADTVVVCAKADVSEGLRAAIAERSGFDRVTPEVVEVPSGYVVGEESALINFVNTGVALPTYESRPYERGIGGRPTLVQNVETLAHLALIARHGPEWFRAVGTPEDPGSTLIQLSGAAVAAPGVYEVPAGMPLQELLELAGGASEPIQAFLIGGYAGFWLTPARALALPLGHAALRAHGSTLGPGMVSALPESSCGVLETARVARFLADESARQCGPCKFGLPAIAGELEVILDGSAEEDARNWIEHWGQLVATRGACHHPDGAVRMVSSALRVFADDLTRHEAGDSCVAATLGGGAAVR